jgi:RNase P subunit RPR2
LKQRGINIAPLSDQRGGRLAMFMSNLDTSKFRTKYTKRLCDKCYSFYKKSNDYTADMLNVLMMFTEKCEECGTINVHYYNVKNKTEF